MSELKPCQHPESERRAYHDDSVVCDACNSVIEQFGQPIDPPCYLGAIEKYPDIRPGLKAELVEAIRNWRKHADFDDHEMRHVTLLDKVDSALESAINTIMGDT